MYSNSDIRLSENFIIVDADYLDKVAFDFIVNYERILERRIPQGDLSVWITDALLDGGFRVGMPQTECQVVFIHDASNAHLDNFTPSRYSDELNAKAFFVPNIGEFLINSYATNAIVDKAQYMLDTLRMLLEHREVKRIVIVADFSHETFVPGLAKLLKDPSIQLDAKLTALSVSPVQMGGIMGENLGFSLSDALGVSSAEIEQKV